MPRRLMALKARPVRYHSRCAGQCRPWRTPESRARTSASAIAAASSKQSVDILRVSLRKAHHERMGHGDPDIEFDVARLRVSGDIANGNPLAFRRIVG